MKQMTTLLIIMNLLFSGQLFAADLTSAKKEGVIGEQASGYIGIVKSASSEIKSLVETVNEKRKARYKKIAISKKLSLKDIEKIGGSKAIEKTKSGNYIKPEGQGWKKK